jgi:hypothetical protein
MKRSLHLTVRFMHKRYQTYSYFGQSISNFVRIKTHFFKKMPECVTHLKINLTMKFSYFSNY